VYWGRDEEMLAIYCVQFAVFSAMDEKNPTSDVRISSSSSITVFFFLCFRGLSFTTVGTV